MRQRFLIGRSGGLRTRKSALGRILGRILLLFLLVTVGVGLGFILDRPRASKQGVAPTPPLSATPTPAVKVSPPLSVARGAEVKIVVVKHQRLLTVFANGRAVKSYPVVFGPDAVNRKLFEGDGCTPEGSYRVRAKYPHRAWQKFIWIDYPNQDDRGRYEAARRRGKVPREGKGYPGVGGEIGVHGTPDDRLNERGADWTLGCISLKKEDIEEVYRVVKVGTPVIIEH